MIYIYSEDMKDNYKNILLIQSSACIAETATFPIDYIKTKMQINHNKVNFISVLKKELGGKSFFSIYNGLKPALLRHSIYTMSRIKIYEELRNRSDCDMSLMMKMFIGGLSGGISQFIASPFDLLKVQYITDNNNSKKTILGTSKNIIKKYGVFGLWRGVLPNVSRAMLVNLGELATYDHSKKLLKKQFNLEDNTPLHVSSSICSGFVASLCCTPADVVKSRMMQNNSQYTGVVNCISSTIRNEGIGAMYKGFFPIWIRLAPWQLVFWVSYEKMRYMVGLEGF